VAGVGYTGKVTTSYLGEQTTVIDQAGKQRRSFSDALGRLAQVDELNTDGTLYASSFYSYNALDDLVKVAQGGQSRFFMYDGLKRLIRASNPEQSANAGLALFDPATGNSQWSTGYSYDASGNLQQKTDARAIQTTFAYDGLNRVISRLYSNDPQNTPAVTYTYDDPQVSNAKGRLTKVASSVSTTEYTQYDPLGRVKGSRQTTSGASQAYQMSYGYNLAGLMVSASYPSGRVVTTSYDGAGRLNTVNGQKAGELNKSYASGFSYTAAGAVSAMQMGNGLVEQTGFNARLQPIQIKLGTATSPASVVQLDYGYGTTNNNGNLLSQMITAPKTAGGSLALTQTYGYDSLNRLVSAGENGTAWQQTYDMDRFGNRAVRATSYIPSPQLTPQSASLTDFSAFDQSNNRLSVTKYPQVLYDGAGNLKRDQVGSTFTYDGENRQLTASVGGTSASYFYDGDGRRVKKVVGSVTTVFVYNARGQMVAEYVSDPVPPPAGGGGTSYLTSDHLGSTRVVTKADGSVKARYDYLPYGEELSSAIGGRSQVSGYGVADSTRQKFTSKERDVESGLDYFGARCESVVGKADKRQH
jgi:YD repeat-containing protein